MSRSVRPGTALQDAMINVRRARRKSEHEFEVALGELFVLSSDAFKQRNGFYNSCKKLIEQNKELEKQVQELNYRDQTEE